jgi:DNA end-binding protein Ku
VQKARASRGEDADAHEMPKKTAKKQPAKKTAAKKTSRRKPRSA